MEFSLKKRIATLPLFTLISLCLLSIACNSERPKSENNHAAESGLASEKKSTSTEPDSKDPVLIMVEYMEEVANQANAAEECDDMADRLSTLVKERGDEIASIRKAIAELDPKTRAEREAQYGTRVTAAAEKTMPALMKCIEHPTIQKALESL